VCNCTDESFGLLDIKLQQAGRTADFFITYKKAHLKVMKSCNFTLQTYKKQQDLSQFNEPESVKKHRFELFASQIRCLSSMLNALN
jgi:hypothetical protein